MQRNPYLGKASDSLLATHSLPGDEGPPQISVGRIILAPIFDDVARSPGRRPPPVPQTVDIDGSEIGDLAATIYDFSSLCNIDLSGEGQRLGEYIQPSPIAQ